MRMRGLCNKGAELDREYYLSMDEKSGDIVYFGVGQSSIRLVVRYRPGLPNMGGMGGPPVPPHEGVVPPIKACLPPSKKI